MNSSNLTIRGRVKGVLARIVNSARRPLKTLIVKAEEYLDSLEEAEKSYVNWTHTRWFKPSTKKHEGVRLFDLASIYFREHRYYTRIYDNSNKIVVFLSWWAWLINNKVRSIEFEIGSFKDDDEEVAIFVSSFNTSESGRLEFSFGYLCVVSDPYALDKMLKRVKEIYGRSL